FEARAGIYPCIRMKGQTIRSGCQGVRNLPLPESSRMNVSRCRGGSFDAQFLPRQLTPSTSTGRPGAQLISLNAAVRNLEQALARVTEPSITVERRLYEQLDPILAEPAAIDRMILALA